MMMLWVMMMMMLGVMIMMMIRMMVGDDNMTVTR